MRTADLAELFSAVADLAWPLLSGVILWKLWPVLLDSIKSRSFRVKVGMMEISAQDATVQLRRSVEDLQRKVEELRAKGQPHEAQTEVHKLSAKPRLAWVDDVPEDNAYEIARLREDGVKVLEMLSTEDAVRILVEEGQPVDVVISDMGRLEDGSYNRTAGLELIRALRTEDFNEPIYVYCSATSARGLRDEVYRAGGSGITSSQVELLEILHREGLV